jgi:hypothetical protein
MDLSTITEQESTEFELLHPTERTPLGVVFTLAGPEHPARKELAAAWGRELRRKINRAGRVTLDDPEDESERELALLAAATLGWKGVEVDGKPVEFSAAAARALYADSRFAWIRRQIRGALGDQDLFIRSSSNA